ncbi:hypothetical protein ES708_11272 [subsurface metagenome]
MMKENNTNNPLVSIGVPVYNGAKYLRECLDSIVRQSYSNWECVIINNKSTDNTSNIAEEYVNQDKRFKLYHTKELLPLVDNWNYCYSMISDIAAFFKIVPADDWIYPEYLEEMVPAMEANKQTGVCSSYRIDETKVSATGLSPYDGNVFNGKDIIARELLYDILDITGSVNTVLYRNDYLKKIPTYPAIHSKENLHCDTDLTYEVLNISDLYFVFKILSFTRQHNESVTSFALRNRTFINAREKLVHKYKHLDKRMERTYSQIRIEYAKQIIKRKLKRDKEFIQWHKNNLPRWFSLKEYLMVFLRKITTGK